jgi:hypothetical protein
MTPSWTQTPVSETMMMYQNIIQDRKKRKVGVGETRESNVGSVIDQNMFYSMIFDLHRQGSSLQEALSAG